MLFYNITLRSYTESALLKKVNYLNNKDILAEIHKSKTSYCYFIDDRYSNFDIIVNSVEEITPETIAMAKQARAHRLSREEYKDTVNDLKEGKNKPKQKEFEIDPATILDEDLVFRVMTFEHIPEELDRKKTHRREADRHAKLNFPPFKHYALIEGEITEVGRSHWKNSLHNGEFCTTHGRMTNRLGWMFKELVKRYARKGSFQGYSYNDEMQSQALIQLTSLGLLFNEAKGDNPFAYYTTTVKNSFRRVLNLEKYQQNIRDELMIQAGLSPSYSRQIDHENEMEALRQAAEEDQGDAHRIGRP
jgi:hypothetical protein